MSINVYSTFSMNGKDSVLPLMDLLMRFVKLPLTFQIMCFWKIFPMDNVNSKTTLHQACQQTCKLQSTLLNILCSVLW